MACLSASVLMAKPGIVKTRDGRTLEGDVTEKSEGVVVTLRGIPTTIARDNIDSVQYVGTIEEQYKKKVAELPKTPTAKDHIDLARWLFDNKAYTLAQKEVDAALQLDPNSTEANTLYTTIQSQLRMDRNKIPATPGPGPGPKPPGDVRPPATGGTGAAHTASMHKYLSPDEMNLVKQAEWPGDDNTVKISIGPEVKRKYIATAQENAASFSALSPVEQAKRILADGTADQRKEIKINNDPAPLAEYKKTIQPMILNGCAAAGCHGGTSGGRLFLYGTPDGDAASYTNFYLLTQTTAQVGGAQRMMIDRDYPDQSLLAEFGLPSEITKVSHPEVKGATWRPMFRSQEDPQYKALMKWMGKLARPAPNYGINFSLEAPEPKPEAPVKPDAPVKPAPGK
jgi:hypothetical protein